jgi:class 3 adenylate cyclase/DNA-binding winged helix-turn-helix (wHTH) protein/tetratricopeptide (TPR) repeat protein
MRYVFGDYEVDTQRYELRHAGTPRALEPQVFSVLVYLVQHRDRMVPKDELLAQLWPQQYVSEAVLSQYLMLVRRAVGDSGSQQRVIKTVRRRGYRFVATVEERTEAPPSQSAPMASVSTALPPPAAERSDAALPLRGGSPLQCPECQHANPAGAKFCNACATPLQLCCPSCGTENPPGARFCYQCATPLTGPPLATRRPTEPLTYTPAYLTEKILTSRAALEGERKQVTVMFADITGSLALIEGLDPEEARQRLDPVLHLMMEAVHRYEGTVNQVLGDGIMALFGAPVAHEDHALRACYAALAMQAALRRYGDEVRQTQGLTVQIRVGLNSGDVVVQAIGNDLSMDYSAVGQTVHLAARMEQLAIPGSILLSAATLHQVEGLVQVKTIGPMAVKGLTKPVEVFELVGAAVVRPWLRAAVAQRPTRFVGRHIELQALGEALARTISEHGQLVAVSGEPGLGKSRLLYEFSHGPLTADWRLLETGAMSYGQATPYLLIRDLLRAYFEIDDQDDEHTMLEKVDKRLTWDMALQETRPMVLALLDMAVDAPEWQSLDPPQRRRCIIEGVKRLLLQRSQAQPLLVLIENLHWIDAGTQAVLDSLIESVPAGRLLLLVSYRPEYQHRWESKTYYTQLRLHPLSSEAAEELLDVLLGEDDELQPVKRLLLERSEGNPFFLEESIRSLVETQVLSGERGAYHLAKPLASLQVPATVQAILAARIDRLPQAEKQLLQSAAVIGREISFPLLQALAEMSEDDLRRGLAHLQKAEFLVETRLYPELAYAFTHALTHDVAYESLLHRQRRVLHARIVTAIERLWADRLATQVEQLAHHAVRGELWEKALGYCHQAGIKATTRSAHREAVGCFEHALSALQHLPETQETLEQAIDLHFNLRNALLPLRETGRIFDHLRRAETLARRLHDQRRLGQTFAYLAEYFRLTGDSTQAVDSGKRALALAAALGDFALQVMATHFLGTVYSGVGEYRHAVDYFSRNVAALTGELCRERLGMTGLPAVMSRTWLVSCLADLGEFDAGIARGEEAIQLAEAVEHPFSLTQAYYALGTLFLRRGALPQAIQILQRGLALCQEAGIVTWFPAVAAAAGYAYILSGRIPEALPLLQQAVARDTSEGIAPAHVLRVAYLSEAYLLAGRRDEAEALAMRALRFARTLQARGNEAYALRLHGEIHAQQEPLASEVADAHYQQALALATELGMRPLQAHCHLGLGILSTKRGQLTRAGVELSAAIELFHTMGMTFWLPRAQATLAQAGYNPLPSKSSM